MASSSAFRAALSGETAEGSAAASGASIQAFMKFSATELAGASAGAFLASADILEESLVGLGFEGSDGLGARLVAVEVGLLTWDWVALLVVGLSTFICSLLGFVR